MTAEPAYYSSFFESCVAAAFFFPLLSFLVSSLISQRYSWIVSILSPLLLLIAAICSIVVFLKVWNHTPYIFSVRWFTIGSSPLSAGILLNNLSALMLIVVSVVSFLIHVFSVGYMAGDHAEKRYFSMLGLFTFSMLGIVLANNLLLIFVFWELVGFSSYMLIGHWQYKPEAAAAAKKAFLFNRIGDAGFLIGLMILWSTQGTFSITEVLNLNDSWSTAAALFIFCGVIGKSAQFPLFTWLPDAMEGPTPVSALIHAATMVAAGVFLLARVNLIFTLESLVVISIVGIITAVIAALAALVQYDIKKILAYSTISQLGLMITCVGAGAPEAAILHLFTHAFFKACLFLCAGSIIHVLHHAQQRAHVHFNVQDIRNLGGLRKKLPFTSLAMLASGGALAGVPLFSGFLSKEAILSALYNWKGDTLNGRWIIFILAFAVSFLTVLYMARLFTKIFLGEERFTSALEVTEAPGIMRAPVALLAAASVWFIVSWNPLSVTGWIYKGSDIHSTGLTIFSATWVLAALIVAYLLFRKRWSFHSETVYNTFYLDDLYEKAIAYPTIALASITERVDRKWIDRFLHLLAYAQVILANLTGWFDKAIVDGTVHAFASVARLIGSLTRSFQGGKIQLYIFWAIFTIIIFLIWSLI